MDSNVAPSKRPRITGLDGNPYSHHDHEVNPLETLAKTAQAASQAEAMRRSKQQQQHHDSMPREMDPQNGPLSTLPQAVSEALQNQQQAFQHQHHHHHNAMFPSAQMSPASAFQHNFYGQQGVPHSAYPMQLPQQQQDALWPWSQYSQTPAHQSPAASQQHQHHIPHSSSMLSQSSANNPMMYLFNPQQSMASSSAAMMMMPSQSGMPQSGPSLGLPMMQSLQNQVPPPHHSHAPSSIIDDHELIPGPPRRMKNRAVKVDNDTVAWLRTNFEPKHGCSLPRRVVYKAYVMHMDAMSLEAANAAGFGKLIRSVFPSVTSRRLGSRGNSRYHYDGLRIKPSSSINLSGIPDEDDEKESPEYSPSQALSPAHSSHNPSSNEASPMKTSKAVKVSSPSSSSASSSSSSSSSASSFSASSHAATATATAVPSSTVTAATTSSPPPSASTLGAVVPQATFTSMTPASPMVSLQQPMSPATGFALAAPPSSQTMLENGSSSQIASSTLAALAHAVDRHMQLPEFPPLTHEEIVVESGFSAPAQGATAADGHKTPTPQDDAIQLEHTVLKGFTAMYRRHCAGVLEAVRAVCFAKVPTMIKSFWSDLPPAILALLSTKRVCDKIEAWDGILFETALHVLVPDVLRPFGGEHSHRAIVAFAEEYLASVKSLFGTSDGLPVHLRAAKVNAAARFARNARRRMVMSSLAQAGHKMLQSASQVAQMRADFEHVDLEAVLDGADWVSGCSRDSIRALADEFATFLEKPRGLSCASQWLANVADRFLAVSGSTAASSAADPMDSSADSARYPPVQTPAAAPASGRKLLVAWTYYTSQVMRELTARNAPTLGAFSTLRLLFDEYMHYIVEVRLRFPAKSLAANEAGAQAAGASAQSDSSAAKSAKRLALATADGVYAVVPRAIHSADLESRSVRSMDCSTSSKDHQPSGASSMSGSDWSTSPNEGAHNEEEEGDEEEEEEEGEEEEEEEDSYDETPRQNKRKSSF